MRAEAAGRIDAARRQLEAERAERLAEANARISARRAEALAEVEAARTAARQSIDEAVASVAGRVVELAVGKRPDPEVVRRAVADVTSVGAGPVSLLSVLIAAAEEEEHIDRTHHWLWPEGYELWFGGAAAITIFGLLFWKVMPFAKKALDDRTGADPGSDRRGRRGLDGARSGRRRRSGRPRATSRPSGPVSSPKPTSRPRHC